MNSSMLRKRSWKQVQTRLYAPTIVCHPLALLPSQIGQADINATCAPYGTPLMTAARNGNAKFAKLLLDAHADLSIQQTDGMTALSWAVVSGGRDVTTLLLDAGADVNQRSVNGGGVLAVAAREGDGDMVLLLQERGALVDQSDSDGRTALHQSVYNGHDKMAEILIRAGANVNHMSGLYGTPLHVAATQGNHKCAWLLLRHGALVSAVDRRLMTPLHGAAQFGHNETIEVLLSAGAEKNAVDIQHHTPLTYATLAGHTDAINLMIDAGCDPNWRNAIGLSAIFAATDVKVVQTLLSRGADVNFIAKDGVTVLHFDAMYGVSGEVLCALYKGGADPTALTYLGETAADCARNAGDNDAAKLLDMLAAKYRETRRNEEEKRGSGGSDA